MTKRIFLTLAVVFASITFTNVSAQHIFSKGDQVVNLGIGIGSYYGGSGYTMTVPPISASFEQGIVDGLINGNASIGVGGYLGYSANKWENTMYGTKYGYKYSYLTIGARGAFHYQFVDKLDTYAGVMLGYNVVSSKAIGDNSYGEADGSSIGSSIFAGARYYFSDKFAAYAEVGYGVSALELGIAIRL